jgi:cellulose synthase operon protein C
LERTRADDSRLDELIGGLYLGGGRPKEAAAAYAQANAKGAGRRAMLGLAQAQANLGDLTASIGTIRDWLRRAPDDRDGRMLLARYLVGNGQCAAAKDELETLIAELPTDALLKNDLAWCYQVTGDQRALIMAEDAHHLAPDLALTQDTLGWIRLQSGDAEGSIKLLQEAAGHVRATPTMKYHLAVALDRLGRRQEAQQALDEALANGTAFAEAKDAEKLRAKLSSN